MFKKIITIMLILILIIGGSIAFLYFKQQNNSNYIRNNIPQLSSYPLKKEFIIKLDNISERTFLKAKISLAYDPYFKKLNKELEGKEEILNDTIFSFFRQIKKENLEMQNDKNMKEQLIKQLNKNLQNGQLNDIYFSEFLVIN